MIAVPGSAGAAAAPRPVAALAADWASGTAPADPGGFDELFTEGDPAKAGRSERRPHEDEQGEEGAAVEGAPGAANLPPEGARPPGDGAEDPATEARRTGHAPSAGPAGAADDAPAPRADPAPYVEGHLDPEPALIADGEAPSQPAPEPDVAEAAPSGIEAETPLSADTDEGTGTPAAESPRTSSPPQPVAAMVAGLKPPQAPTAAPQHDRHRHDAPDGPAPDGATVDRDAQPAPHTTVAAKPDHAPGGDHPPQPDRPFSTDAQQADPLALASDSRATAPEVRPAPGLIARAPHPLPDGFVLRLAPHLPHQGARAVEITLTPEELGKVRMHVALSGDALTLTIAAHRPETLDLLRTHIDQLAREFRDLGFERLEFGFARDQGQQSLAGQGGGSDPHEGNTAGSAPDSAAARASPPARTSRDLALAGSAGLDLRL